MEVVRKLEVERRKSRRKVRPEVVQDLALLPRRFRHRLEKWRRLSLPNHPSQKLESVPAHRGRPKPHEPVHQARKRAPVSLPLA